MEMWQKQGFDSFGAWLRAADTARYAAKAAAKKAAAAAAPAPAVVWQPAPALCPPLPPPEDERSVVCDYGWGQLHG